MLLHRLVRRRSRRLLVVLSVAVLGAGLAADRIAAAVVADRISARLACLAGLPTEPGVHIAGFPFLPQALAGRYPRIAVEADHLRRGTTSVSQVSAVLDGVTIPRGATGTLAVDTVQVGFEVPFTDLPARVQGRQMTYGPGRDGLMSLSTQVSSAAGPLPVTVLARPVLDDGRLTVVPEEVEVFGIRRPAEQLLRRLGVDADQSLALPELPAGLVYRSASATPTGLRFAVGGRSLRLDVGERAGGERSGATCGTAAAAR